MSCQKKRSQNVRSELLTVQLGGVSDKTCRLERLGFKVGSSHRTGRRSGTNGVCESSGVKLWWGRGRAKKKGRA